jgi:hypothetical protein
LWILELGWVGFLISRVDGMMLMVLVWCHVHQSPPKGNQHVEISMHPGGF